MTSTATQQQLFILTVFISTSEQKLEDMQNTHTLKRFHRRRSPSPASRPAPAVMKALRQNHFSTRRCLLTTETVLKQDANQLTSITSTVSCRRPAAPYICSCLHSLMENYPSTSHNEMMKDREAFRKAEEHETLPRGSVMSYQHKHLTHSQQIASCSVLCDIYER